MEITMVYVISQIITIVYYAVLSISYLLKDRVKILLANFFSHLGQTIAYVLQNGYTGAAMACIMMVRDLVFVFTERKIDNKKINLIIFLISTLSIMVLTIFTYNGPLSLLSVIAALISTFALWQTNVKLYKILGMIGALFWLSYNIYIMSIMGIILETILTIFTIIGNIKDRK